MPMLKFWSIRTLFSAVKKTISMSMCRSPFKKPSWAAGSRRLFDPQRRGRFDRGEITGDWTRDPRPRRSKSHPSRPQGTAKQPNPKKPAGPKAAKRSKTAGLKIKGADVEYTLHVEFLEAARGGVRHIDLVNGKRLKVSIPPGTEPGQVLHLKGQGMGGIGGAADGDAYIEILVDPHAFSRTL